MPSLRIASPAPGRTWPLYALAFSFVLTGFRHDVGFIFLDPSLLVIPICLGMLVGQVVVRRGLRPLDGVGVLALLVVLSAWMSFFGAIDVMTWLKRAMKVTWLFGLYLFFVNCAFDRRRLEAFMRGSLWACAGAGAAIIVQMVGRWSTEGYGEVFGAAGIFANSNEAATYLAIYIVMGLALYASGTHDAMMGRRSLLTLIGVSALGVLFSRSRSGVICLIVVSGVLFFRTSRVRRFVLGAITLLVILSLTSSTAVIVNRLLATAGMSGDPDYDEFVQFGSAYRVYLVELYWTVIKANPVFGIGAGNYGFIGQLEIELPPAPREAGWVDDSAFNLSSHNGFLNWWVEAGTLGLVAFGASVAYAMTAVWRARRKGAQDPWWRAVGTGTVGGLGVFALSNLPGEFGVSEPRYWILLALASITVRHLKVRAG